MTVPYQTPAPDVASVVDAPLVPAIYPAPGGRYLALVHLQPHPPVTMLARPYRALAGLRIDPELGARRRLRRTTGLSVLRVSDGTQRSLPLPDDPQIGTPAWAPDGRRLAIMVDHPDGVGVWVADAETGQAHEVAGLRVCDVLAGEPSFDGGAVRWSRDGRSLLALAAPASRTALPDPPIEPRTEETAGKRAQAATYQDLLRTRADEEAFEALATSVVCRVDPVTGERRELGPPGLYQSVTDSPDGSHLLVHRLQRPFSFRVPWFWFSRRIEVWNAAGGQRTVVAGLPASEEVPRQGVPVGPRLAGWAERSPASLLWAEALDGGDPVSPADHRDRIFMFKAPFTGDPEAVLDLRHRYLGWYDLDAPHELLLIEYDRDRRWQTVWLCDLEAPGGRRAVFDLSADDAYGDPGTPMMTVHPDGTRTVTGDGSAIYLRGDGATPAGNRPFLDRFDLVTTTATRLHESPHGCLEHVIGFTSAARDEVMTWHESPRQPPNLVAVSLTGGHRRPLTNWPDPHPHLTGSSKRLVTCDRGDGVMLSGMLHLPDGHDPVRDGRLPLVIWAYPFDYGGTDTASQVRAGTAEFVRLTALGPEIFVLGGYAVLADATMPVIGDPETMNDTYIEQISAAARAHIRALDEAGIIDPGRVAVGGHSYGGFMTANLLAHTGDFAAGIARSGAYNRSLTPFGFQTERRNFWEAQAVYDRVSPLRYAHQITAPLLLIHGEQDTNPGTFPIQSERLFQALQGNGGTGRLVMLPHEGHGYLARESVLHVLAEEFGWLDRWLRPSAGRRGDGAGQPAAATGPAMGPAMAGQSAQAPASGGEGNAHREAGTP
jgi:dipeptidyl aminopeptidase/acylaminoacyl peptidase